MRYGICERCGEPVDSPQAPAFPITGWEVLRGGGGANSIKNRVRVPNRVRHAGCLPRANEDQSSLFPSTPSQEVIR